MLTFNKEKSSQEINKAFNLFMSKFEEHELWVTCDFCGEEIREDIGSHSCTKVYKDWWKHFSVSKGEEK